MVSRRDTRPRHEGVEIVDTSIQEQSPEVLRFGFAETTLQTVLVARSEAGLAAVLLGDDRRQLGRALGDAFSDAVLIEDQADLNETLAEIVGLVARPGAGLSLALDLRGSALQLAVWNALRAIPGGETRSYGQVAAALPLPATAQEVGAACAANVLAVVVPCHRVVKADGSLSGYRWGVRRKRELLRLERTA